MTTITAAKPTSLSAPTRRRFTVDEYYAMAKAGVLTRNDRVELLDGDIILMTPIGDWHAANVDEIVYLLIPPLRGKANVRIQNPISLSNVSEPQPDIVILHWRDDFYRAGKPTPDDVLLIIEVSDSSLEYDRTDKLSAYARAGIPEFWIVSRDDRRIEAYTEPSEGTYSKVRHIGPGDTIAPQAFPDVTLEVGQFFPKSKPKQNNKS